MPHFWDSGTKIANKVETTTGLRLFAVEHDGHTAATFLEKSVVEATDKKSAIAGLLLFTVSLRNLFKSRKARKMEERNRKIRERKEKNDLRRLSNLIRQSGRIHAGGYRIVTDLSKLDGTKNFLVELESSDYDKYSRWINAISAKVSGDQKSVYLKEVEKHWHEVFKDWTKQELSQLLEELDELDQDDDGPN